MDDVEPLPIPLTVPGTEPMSREELNRRLSCDVKIEVSAAGRGENFNFCVLFGGLGFGRGDEFGMCEFGL